MAVPAYKREENEMTIINRVQDLMKEVIRLSKSEKVLPKKVEKILKQSFIEDAMGIYKRINSANKCNLFDSVESVVRRQLQLKAKLSLIDLYSQIKLNIAYLGTNYGKYENLISIIDSVQKLLAKWVKSDIERKDKQKEEKEK